MSIKVPREVWGLFLSAVAAAGYVYYNGMLSPKPPPIIATGKWRDNPNLTAALAKELNQSVRILQQAEEGLLSAQSAHAIVRDAKILENRPDIKFVLYVETGRGSTQMTVLDRNGQKEAQALSKTGISELGDKADQLAKLNDFKANIGLLVMYGSYHHQMKEAGAVVPDEDYLSVESLRPAKRYLTMIQDHNFEQPEDQAKDQKQPKVDKPSLTFVPEWVNDSCYMLVIRNVRIGDKLRKPSWGTQQPGPFVDLGSGKAALTDPKSGTVIKNDAGVEQSVKYEMKTKDNVVPIPSIAAKVLAVQSQTYAGDT